MCKSSSFSLKRGEGERERGKAGERCRGDKKNAQIRNVQTIRFLRGSEDELFVRNNSSTVETIRIHRLTTARQPIFQGKVDTLRDVEAWHVRGGEEEEESTRERKTKRELPVLKPP